MTSSGELEQVLTGGDLSTETRPLLQNHVARSHLDSSGYIFCGMYNKANYLSYCYNLCWLENRKQGPKLHQFLCFGDHLSRCSSLLASFALFVFALLPFAAVWPFVVDVNESMKRDDLIILLVFTSVMELLFFLWHFHCIYITKTINYEIWEASWFTFVVKKETLKVNDLEDSQGNFSMLDVEGKLQIIDVSVTDLCRMNSVLHQISVNEREKLALVMEKKLLDRAGVILYSEEFIQEFIMHSMYEAFILATLSVCSFVLLIWKTITTIQE